MTQRSSDEALYALVRKLDDHIVETRRSRVEVRHSIDCLKDSFQAFEQEYGPLLKAGIARQKFWNGVRDRSIERGVVFSLGCAALAAVAGLVMLGVKHLKSLLGIL